MRRGHVVALAAGGAVLVAAGVTAGVLAGGGNGSGASPGAAGTATGEVADPPSAAATSPGDGLTPAQRSLVATLGPLRVRDCVPAPAERVTEPPGDGLGPDEGVDAAVVCQTLVVDGEPGPAQVVARHYRDAATLTADADRRAGAVDDVGSCAAGEPSTETWGRSTRRLGTFLCDRGAAGTPAGTFAIYWTVTADQTALSASSTDPAGLIAWWRDFTKP
ncbi:hypothetical protein I6A84_44220 [Frankia sp. CNm7]|uniref:Uncharacterized protein n=1 Tax=Frankia nepalensis TaxID=1836974 RepID=A0A937RJX0_9ACTN|nr:hypothetical protein [Frankia nepalensis]MBL7496816.1 hypothetical protein [Frankia nepalensis]MBL7510973.1 hypothetical protein [Frankia nepalensis]MBL7524862.1 hypothetical protein [Frankia nepalensis]MBL7633636.1 hypothetical protein [Frankia nepalensis]